MCVRHRYLSPIIARASIALAVLIRARANTYVRLGLVAPEIARKIPSTTGRSRGPQWWTT